MENASDLATWDHQYVWHPFTQMRDWCLSDPVVLTSGKGVVLRDSKGREYLDGNSSIWTNIHGHGHSKLIAAIKNQLDALAHSSFLGTSNAPAIQLAKKLICLFPKNTLTKVFYSDNGSTAVEVALKMAMQFSQLMGRPKHRFAAFEKAYHGDTVGAASVGGIETFSDRFTSMHFQSVRLKGWRDLERLDPDIVKDLAGIIIEPIVQGTAGIRLWPKGMLKNLRHWCDENEVPLIFDEVLTGFGRTGRLFACEHEEVLPDFLALAKGLTGGLLPLGATLTTDTIYHAFLGEYKELKTFFYGHSYCGNPLGCAAAIANLDIFKEEKVIESLPRKIDALSQVLSHLKSHPHISKTRQAGLISGLDLIANKAENQIYDWRKQMGARVCLAARRFGLLTRPIRDTLVLMPPLCATPQDIYKMGDALEKALDTFGNIASTE